MTSASVVGLGVSHPRRAGKMLRRAGQLTKLNFRQLNGFGTQVAASST